MAYVLEDPVAWGRYLGELRTGSGRHRAAKAVGVTARSVEAWLRTRSAERGLVEEAASEALERVEDKLWEAALDGEPWAVERWLKSRGGERWNRPAQGGAGADGLTARDVLDMVRDLAGRPLPALPGAGARESAEGVEPAREQAEQVEGYVGPDEDGPPAPVGPFGGEPVAQSLGAGMEVPDSNGDG